jgi:hypothetical protein
MGESDWDWASKTNFNKEVTIYGNLWKRSGGGKQGEKRQGEGENKQ